VLKSFGRGEYGKDFSGAQIMAAQLYICGEPPKLSSISTSVCYWLLARKYGYVINLGDDFRLW
jgi:hypothetical protein